MRSGPANTVATPVPARPSAQPPAVSVHAPHRLERIAVAPRVTENGALQRMSFARFAQMSYLSPTYWSTQYDADETNLLAAEKRVRTLHGSAAGTLGKRYTGELNDVASRLAAIEKETFAQKDYRKASRDLEDLECALYGLLTLNVIDDVVDSLPITMQGKGNEEAILQALAPGAETRKTVLDIGSEHGVAFAKTRRFDIVAALNEVDQRIAADRTEFDGKPKAVKHIQLTGSDLHNRGRQVVIIEYASGEKEVYKPRSVQPDAALVGAGESSGFGFLNTLSKHVNLPTMGLAGKGEKSKEHGYVEFKTKALVISSDEVSAYYGQLGQIAVAAKLFGANDLHQDNVMVTAGGNAAIIDAETSFLPYVMAAKTYAATALPSALKSFTAGNRLSNNAFVTDAELKTHGDNAYHMVDELRAGDLKKNGPYRADLEGGIAGVIHTVKANKAKIVEHLCALLGRTTQARYVPLETSLFKSYLRAYHDGVARKLPDETKGALDDTVAAVAKAFVGEGFELQEKQRPFLRTALEADMKAGDIPIFHFSPKTNELRYRGVTLGDSVLLRGGEKFVAEVVARIAETNPDQVVNDLLHG
jgi:hypothetical protein